MANYFILSCNSDQLTMRRIMSGFSEEDFKPRDRYHVKPSAVISPSVGIGLLGVFHVKTRHFPPPEKGMRKLVQTPILAAKPRISPSLLAASVE